MKYLVVALCSLTLATSVLLVSFNFDACCEYLGLLAPEGVSERPGVEHAQIEAALEDGAIPESVRGIKLHQPGGPVSLPDLDHQVREIDYAAAKFTVFVWVSALCPTSGIYEERLNALKSEFGSEVAFWAVNSDEMEKLPELRSHFQRKEGPLKLTVLKDEGNVLADRWGARVCPDVFVFSREGKLEYRGGVDDSRNPQEVRESYLREVLRSLLRGEKPRWRYQKANGCCPIDRVRPANAPQAAATK